MNKPLLLRVGATVAACAGLLAHAARYAFVSDDAFIFARYARNLVEGHGLVFNPGERVEGFTSMLWVLVLAAGGAVGIDYVFAMRALGVLCALGCVWAVHRLALAVGPQRPAAALVAPVLTAAAAPFACWSPSGLETPGFALAVLASVAAFRVEPSRREALYEGAWLSACVLLRPEGAFVVAALVLLRVLRGGVRGAVRAVAGWLMPLLGTVLLSVFRVAYYGDIVPNTARAKDAAGGQLGLGVAYAANFFADHGTWCPWLAVFVLGLCARREPRLQACALVGAVLVAVTVWVGGDGLPMYRFFVPVIPLFAVLCAHAVERVLLWPGAGRARPAVYAVAVGAVVVCACAFASPDREGSQFRLYDFQQRVEIPRWTEVGRWLARTTPADASVACVPIGAVGYYSRRVVRDMVGLTDRHIAMQPADPDARLVGHRKHDGAYILGLHPTILLTGNVRVLPRPLALTDPEFGRGRAPAIRVRERDLFVPALARDYEPRIARLPSGTYLHYFQRR